jgi:hypothetical protein
MEGPNKDKWVPSAKAEINNFLSRDAWQKFPRKDLAGRKPIPVKWIFKIKEEQDGTQRYKSRIVLKGYVMVPGVDYTESFSPVATDTTVRTSIAMALYRQKEGWTIEMIDIEAAFLNAELESDRPASICGMARRNCRTWFYLGRRTKDELHQVDESDVWRCRRSKAIHENALQVSDRVDGNGPKSC